MKSILKFITVLLTAAFLIPTAFAQGTNNPNTKVKVTLGKLKHEERLSPQLKTGDDPKPWVKEKKWVHFEIPFRVMASPAPKSGYIDSLTFKFYIAAVNPDRGKQYLKLTKEVKYVNIPVGEDIFATVFMSPSSVKRLTGSDGGRGSWIKYSAVTVTHNGKVIAIFSSERGKMEKWYDVTSASMVDTDNYPLLNKDETPFAPFWYDRYPEVMHPGAPGAEQ